MKSITQAQYQKKHIQLTNQSHSSKRRASSLDRKSFSSTRIATVIGLSLVAPDKTSIYVAGGGSDEFSKLHALLATVDVHVAPLGGKFANIHGTAYIKTIASIYNVLWANQIRKE